MQENVPSQAEHVKPRLVRRVSVTQNRRYTSKEGSKCSEKRPSKAVYNVRMRSEAEKKIKEATAPDKYPKQKSPKQKVGLIEFCESCFFICIIRPCCSRGRLLSCC